MRVKKYGRAKQATDDNIIRRMRTACWIPMTTDTFITLYYIKNQQDATLAVLFISHCKITLHVSDAFCVYHQEY